MTKGQKPKKVKQCLFGTTRIADVTAANELIETSAIDIKKAQKGLLLSFLSLIFLTVAVFCQNSGTVFSIMFFFAHLVTTLVSYSIGGGFKKVLSIGGEIVEILTLPFTFLTSSLLLDFILGAIFLVLTLISLLLFPYFFLGLLLLKGHKIQRAAQKYLTENTF